MADWLERGVAAAGEALQIKPKTQMKWIWRILEHFAARRSWRAEKNIKARKVIKTWWLCMHEEWWKWEHMWKTWKQSKEENEVVCETIFACSRETYENSSPYSNKKSLKLLGHILHFKKESTDIALDHGHSQWAREPFTSPLQPTITTTRDLWGRCRISVMEIPLPFCTSRDCAWLEKMTECIHQATLGC